MKKSAFFLLPLAILSSGCGATSIRLSVGPSLDDSGHAGFESTLSLGGGMPLEFTGRSHHYVQASAHAGGGYEGKTGVAFFSTGGQLDYIYFAEPKLLVRAGLPFSFRFPYENPNIAGVGGHLTILPLVLSDLGGPIVGMFCLGPDFRVEGTVPTGGGPWGARFSLPLVAELSALIAGD